MSKSAILSKRARTAPATTAGKAPGRDCNVTPTVRTLDSAFQTITIECLKLCFTEQNSILGMKEVNKIGKIWHLTEVNNDQSIIHRLERGLRQQKKLQSQKIWKAKIYVSVSINYDPKLKFELILESTKLLLDKSTHLSPFNFFHLLIYLLCFVFWSEDRRSISILLTW